MSVPQSPNEAGVAAGGSEQEEGVEGLGAGGAYDDFDSFLDDDSLMVSQLHEADESLYAMDGSNYLERDDFDRELGSPSEDPFSEDFSSVSKLNIVDVVGDDRAGRPLVLVFAYRLPSNKTFDHDKLWRYLLHVLDKLVEQDYTLVYFHYGLRSHNKPPIKWMINAYKQLDRRYKKNLKAMYLVHPTRFICLVWNLFKPFISAKFERKLHYVNYVSELKGAMHIDQLVLPTVIAEHDKQLVASAHSPLASSGNSSAALDQLTPAQQFGVSLQYIMENHPGHDLPPIVTDLLAHLRAHALQTEGIFRRSANLAHLREIQAQVNRGECIKFVLYEVHLAAVLLKTFLRELSEPVMTYQQYNALLAVVTVAEGERIAAIRLIVRQLPPENHRLLKAIMQFLAEVASNSKHNLMDASNLSVVFGPNLAWPSERKVSLADLHGLNQFCYRLLTHQHTVFE